ncbi:MAG TPA: hypothetical protein VHT03_04050 [Rhizomicrobium sp.]|jgi:hypothetical protein|nr:hypothetical protein [Rhizomicrobium sp.]
MTDTVVVADENTGFRFSWGLAFAGGVVAIVVTLVLLILGSGFGLLLVNPLKHTGPSLPTFLTAGAIYFFAVQAFGFAVGGHLAGRLLGPVIETRGQEELRAAAHGLVAWAVAIVGAMAIVAFTGLAAAGGGAAIAALYGARGAHSAAGSATAYTVDVLFRPEVVPDTGQQTRGTPAQPRPDNGTAETGPHAEAERILQDDVLHGGQLALEDRVRLSDIVAQQAGISHDAAAARVNRMQAGLQDRINRTAEAARKTASYAALWMAFSLIFGAVVAIFAAISARLEDDRAT